MDALMNSLSLNETGSNIFNFAANINGHPTEFVIGTFKNQNLIAVTQFEKLYSLYSISVDQTENGVCAVEPTFSVQPLFGTENLHAEAAARFITAQLNIRKQLLVFLSLKNYSRDTVIAVVAAIRKYSKDVEAH